MLWFKRLILPLFLVFCGQIVTTTPTAVHQAITQEAFASFWQWKAACDACYSTGKTPLTQQAFLTELNAFVQSQNNGPFSDQNNWVKTGLFGKQKPTPEFYSTTKFEPYVQKLEIPANAEVAFHGDVHGDIKSFNAFIEDLSNKGYMDHANPFKIKKQNFYIIMLGDYTDRGQYGAEVLYAILRMKQANPNHFFMVRGNHEDAQYNAHYGLIQELARKFSNSSGTIMDAIHRTYNYLPVALYLKSGTNALQCCHGGMEIGFDHTKKLLNTSDTQKFVLVDVLKKLTRVNALSSQAKKAFNYIHKEDTNHYNPENIGFMWNDFTFDHEDTSNEFACVFEQYGRGKYPQKITQYLLKHDSTPTCTVRGVMRAHQHGHETMQYILNRNGHTHEENTGVAKLWPPQDHMQQPAHALWDGIVCTFSVSPGAYGSSFNYNFDSYGILKTAPNFDDWRLAMTRLVTTQ